MKSSFLFPLFGLLGALGFACQSESPQVGSQTNWLRACDESSECGEYSCVCGTCTKTCEEASQCDGPSATSCLAASEEATVAACRGSAPDVGLCLPRCDEEECPDGTMCVAGACVGTPTADVSVTVDPAVKHQVLVGLGSTIAYTESLILDHPEREALLDAMFLESGFELLRLRNAFDGNADTDLAVTMELLGEASERLGENPAIYLTSGSPPAALKANGDRYCANSDVTCTLVRNAEGDFDYAGFAEYWRSSLEAYAAQGVVPEFVSIQNNSNYVPEDDVAIEACRFLPVEGTTTVELPDESVEAEFPGYAEAAAAVADALSTLTDSYSLTGPENGSTTGVVPDLASLTDLGSVSYHMYGFDLENVAQSELEALQELSAETGKPSLQSEMQADGFDTARLLHYTLAVAGSSAYLQLGFVGSTPEDESPVLLRTDETSFTKEPAYHALTHFSRFTQRGWTRVDAASDSEALLSSGWLSPEEDALTLVFINRGQETLHVELDLPSSASNLLSDASVVRTVFEGTERSQVLGSLSPEHIVTVPGRSILTIATNND